jgi:BlaI family penicillinase repressor
MKERITLTESEWLLMQVLWEKGACTLRELTDAVRSETGWTPNAVISFLKRMELKQAVSVEGERRYRVYRPLLDRDETILEETESWLSRVYRGDMHLMMQNAVRCAALTKAEADELIRLLLQGGEQQ